MVGSRAQVGFSTKFKLRLPLNGIFHTWGGVGGVCGGIVQQDWQLEGRGSYPKVN